MVALSKSPSVSLPTSTSTKHFDRSKKWALIGNRLVEPSNQDVWMLNYHLQGNEGVYRALIDQDQIGQLDSISWPERLFQFLETTKTLPADCDFLKIIP